MWPIEARNAAIANNYFTCAINRVGTVCNSLTLSSFYPANAMLVCVLSDIKSAVIVSLYLSICWATDISAT